MWCWSKNISAEMILASSPLDHVNQKYKFLGIDGAHHKQKSLHMSNAKSQQGGLKPWKPVRAKY